MESNISNARVSIKAGASIVSIQPVFSPDSKYVFTPYGNNVKVFSSLSGECVNCLKGHTNRIRWIQNNPKNSLQIYTCSLDKTIKLWDYADGINIKTFEFDHHVHYYRPLSLLKSYGEISQDGLGLVILQEEKQKFSLNAVKLQNGVTIEPIIQDLGFKSYAKKPISVGCKEEYVAYIRKRKLKVKSLKDRNSDIKTHEISKGLELTCVACHPSDVCVATGLSDGSILLWWTVLSTGKASTTKLHWHPLPVCALAYTAEGSYLLSGGHECVLVKWQHGTNSKDFLPRLGAPIKSIDICRDNTLYATAHEDNVIHLISSSLRIVQVLQGLTFSNSNVRQPIGLIQDPRSKAIVLNGKPGHLQFYSLHEDKQLFNLDIVAQNYISPENLRQPIVITEVDSAAFSSDGKWLATTEFRDDKVTALELRLKFWEFDEEKQRYKLNTSVDLPHEKRICNMKFRPEISGKASMLVTTSVDGKFKLWVSEIDKDIYRTLTRWSCDSLGFYRNRPATCTDFTEDGSLLAVSFDTTLTIWDPETNVMKSTLECYERITHVRFGQKSCSYYAVVATTKSLIVWNLLKLDIEWQINLLIDAIAVDSLSEHMAVFTRDKNLFIFAPNDPKPVFSKSSVTNKKVLGAIFIPHIKESMTSLSWSQKSQLYFINRSQELLTIDDTPDSEEQEAPIMSLPQNLPQSALSLIVSQYKTKAVPEIEHQKLNQEVKMTGIKEILYSPSHLLPPIQSLCQQMLNSLMLESKTVDSGTSNNKSELSDDDDDDEEMSTENDESSSDMEIDQQKQKDVDIKKNGKPSVNQDIKISAKKFKWLKPLIKDV